MSALLEVDGVSKTYGSGRTAVTALEHAKFSIESGEFVALVGPSGSGKTTLVSIVGGLLTPSEGTVVLGGLKISDMSSGQLTKLRAERVGFVFQSANLVPFMTARENLMYVTTLRSSRMSRSDARKRADELLGELGLEDRAKSLPAELSGGERQRVAIGRALMNDPEIILVDEPTAALDTERGKQVVQLLASEIKDRGKTGIMVTHDMRMVDYTDRVMKITDGVLDASGA